jgi:hypothetical protein
MVRASRRCFAAFWSSLSSVKAVPWGLSSHVQSRERVTLVDGSLAMEAWRWRARMGPEPVSSVGSPLRNGSSLSSTCGSPPDFDAPASSAMAPGRPCGRCPLRASSTSRSTTEVMPWWLSTSVSGAASAATHGRHAGLRREDGHGDGARGHVLGQRRGRHAQLHALHGAGQHHQARRGAGAGGDQVRERATVHADIVLRERLLERGANIHGTGDEDAGLGRLHTLLVRPRITAEWRSSC